MKKYHAFDEDGLKAHDIELLRAAADRMVAKMCRHMHNACQNCDNCAGWRAAIMGDEVKE